MSFACGMSGKNFSTRVNLQRHIKYVHGGDSRYNRVSPVVNGSTLTKHPFTYIVEKDFLDVSERNLVVGAGGRVMRTFLSVACLSRYSLKR